MEYKVPRNGRIPTIGEKHSAHGKERWDLNRASPKDNFPLPHIDVQPDKNGPERQRKDYVHNHGDVDSENKVGGSRFLGKVKNVTLSGRAGTDLVIGT
ncbi:hypothetical protein CR513_14035, partial [Mucuna pruriens]